MPSNKSYIGRVRVINRCLYNSKRYYTLQELTDRINERLDCDVKERTVEKDIKDMRAEGAPIINKPGTGYIYDPPAYNHFELKLQPAQLEKIKLAASLLQQIPGLDVHEELNQIFEDLQIDMDIDESQFIQFDSQPNYEGARYMVDILEAIKGKTVVSFDYQPFQYDAPLNLQVHPYLLKEFNNRWYLIGLQESKREQKQFELQQFALDRIKSKVKAEGGIPFYQYEFDASSLYQNIYGMSTPKNGKVEKVVLRFSEKKYPYIATKPLHHTQQQNGSDFTFEYQLIPNLELEGLILSFGGDVEVVEPVELRNRIKKIISETGNKYLL